MQQQRKQLKKLQMLREENKMAYSLSEAEQVRLEMKKEESKKIFREFIKSTKKGGKRNA